MKRIILFTDGSYLGNPGPGGWACLLRCGSVETEISGTEARVAGGRAGTDASVSVLTQQVRSLESRMAELADAFANGTTGRVEALSGQVSEVREAVLKVAERVGSTAFLTRRVADLEIRLAETNAKVDRPDSI